MPTGYTECIKDGVTFKQFTLRCARAMGALITMRDEPLDAPIPDKFEPSPYHVEQLALAQQRMAELNALTTKELAVAAEKAYVEDYAAWRKEEFANLKLKDQYVEMLNQVKAWTPPTPNHQGLKDFMQQQIEQSIQWDCDNNVPAPVAKSPLDYYNAKHSTIQWSIDYHTKQIKEERERVTARTAWVGALLSSFKE